MFFSLSLRFDGIRIHFILYILRKAYFIAMGVRRTSVRNLKTIITSSGSVRRSSFLMLCRSLDPAMVLGVLGQPSRTSFQNVQFA